VTLPNFDKMLRLADEFFSVRTDPDQLNVTPAVIDRLKQIHPATLSDESTADGPVVWILLIPTTGVLMNRFLAREINERELLDLTPAPGVYAALYLCSALVLPEYRRKGLAAKVAGDAVAAIRRDHPITTLFYWEFSGEGRRLAEAISRECGLPLLVRAAGE
jgi:GNAT superfamily N-acetyltransferase